MKVLYRICHEANLERVVDVEARRNPDRVFADACSSDAPPHLLLGRTLPSSTRHSQGPDDFTVWLASTRGSLEEDCTSSTEELNQSFVRIVAQNGQASAPVHGLQVCPLLHHDQHQLICTKGEKVDGYSFAGVSASPTPLPLLRVCAHISSFCMYRCLLTDPDKPPLFQTPYRAAVRQTPVPGPRLRSADCACTLLASRLRHARWKIQARPHDQA
jgi:hypothetical protein